MIRDPYRLPEQRGRHSDWRDEAQCAGVDPELFYADTALGKYQAKSVCRSCEVISECLTYALGFEGASFTRFGVWGGMTAEERHEHDKGRRRSST